MKEIKPMNLNKKGDMECFGKRKGKGEMRNLCNYNFKNIRNTFQRENARGSKRS